MGVERVEMRIWCGIGRPVRRPPRRVGSRRSACSFCRGVSGLGFYDMRLIGNNKYFLEGKRARMIVSVCHQTPAISRESGGGA
jgi:hypothetical protein